MKLSSVLLATLPSQTSQQIRLATENSPKNVNKRAPEKKPSSSTVTPGPRMPSKPPPAAPRSRLGTKLLRVTSLYDITAGQIHAYVRGLHCRIRQQAKTIRRLRRKVAGLVRLRKLKAAPTEQVPDGEDDDDVMKALEKAEQEARAAEPLDVKAFVDDIKKTAEDFDYQNRYIYEPTSGMYYDPETGYYYNAVGVLRGNLTEDGFNVFLVPDLRTSLRRPAWMLPQVQPTDRRVRLLLPGHAGGAARREEAKSTTKGGFRRMISHLSS